MYMYMYVYIYVCTDQGDKQRVYDDMGVIETTCTCEYIHDSTI